MRNLAAAIGSGEHGNCQNINISGGRIFVHTTDSTVDIGGYGPTSTCENIIITGGTILNTDEKSYVNIGGRNPGQWNDTSDTNKTNVYISGGNVRGKVFGADHAQLSSASGTPVYLTELCFSDFGLGAQRSNDRIAVNSISVLPEPAYSYGLNDTYLSTSSQSADTVMNAWLPAGIDCCSIETDPAFLGYTYGMRKEDISLFAGNVSAGKQSTLYPRLWFLFDDNYATGDLTKDSASYFIGQKKTENIYNEKSGGPLPEYYSLDKEGKVPLLKPNGTFYSNVTDPAKGTKWTDESGKIIFEPGTLQNYYVNGVKLYAIRKEIDNPPTGDKNDIYLWILLIAAGSAALISHWSILIKNNR